MTTKQLAEAVGRRVRLRRRIRPQTLRLARLERPDLSDRDLRAALVQELRRSGASV
jgi:hypothetical protein